MKGFITSACLLWFGLTSYEGFSQLSDTIFYSSKDTYINSQFPSHPYDNDTSMKSGTNVVTGKFGSNIYYQRVFVEFDVSSIPTGAIIHNAELRLRRSDSITANFDWKTKLVTTNWDEDITANTQPTISNLTNDVATDASTTNTTQRMDVTDMVQRMVYGAVSNYGWSVQVDNESYSGYSGTWFYTNNHSTTAFHPQLFIEYYLPLSATNIVITHESATSASDGGVSLDIVNGASSSFTYNWVNSSGANIGVTTEDLSGVSYGWYGLEVTGSSPYNETYYMGFLVGTECEEVTITYTALGNFVTNNFVYTHLPDKNFPDHSLIRAESGTISGAWYDSRTLTRFHTWMDDAFTINQADLEFYNALWSHYTSSSPNGSGKLNIITQDWYSDVVTHNLIPTSNSSSFATMASPPTGWSSGGTTADMTELWETWKSDNSLNYGAIYELDDYSNVYNRNYYGSPFNTTSSDRPEWTYRLALNRSENPIFCSGAESRPFNHLKKELDGGYGESFADTLNFTFDENYEVDTALFLVTTLYDDDNEAIASCNAAGVTSNGMHALKYDFDDNRYLLDLSGITALVSGRFYLLEVKNSKGDTFYLKFKHND